MVFFYVFWCPLAAQMESKNLLKSIKNQIIFWIDFLMRFCVKMVDKMALVLRKFYKIILKIQLILEQVLASIFISFEITWRCLVNLMAMSTDYVTMPSESKAICICIIWQSMQKYEIKSSWYQSRDES